MWDVTPREAIQIQHRLNRLINLSWDGRKVSTLAGLDVSFPDKKTVLGAIVILSWPDLKVLETKTVTQPCRFPYVPGLLAFREVPVLLFGLSKIRREPDLLLCDAQGLAHQRRMGLATHLGILLDKPAIGCAKSVLYGTYEESSDEKGSISYMYDDFGDVIGAAVRTRKGVKPVYVSIGHRIDLEKAIEVVLACSPKYRIPEPLRLAHKLSVGEVIDVDASDEEGSLF